jgi:hypothetical protein
VEQILDFLRAIDEKLALFARKDQHLNLHLIGRVALILRLGRPLSTRDVDCLQIPPGSDEHELQKKAIESFGWGTAEAIKWGLYLEEVPAPMPPVPAGYQKNSEQIPGNWRVLSPRLPRPNDLAVTKLRRFHITDREDIRIMCDQGWLNKDELRQGFESAFCWHRKGDEAAESQLQSADANLESVIAYLEGKTRSLQ